MNVLILGSKKYPATPGGDDPLPSGGMEVLVNGLVPELSRGCKVTVVTRRFRGDAKESMSKNVVVKRVPFIGGKLLRGPSFNMFSFFKSMGAARDADAILCFGIMASTIGCLLGKLHRKPVVSCPCGIASVQFGFPLGTALRFLERHVYRRSDVVVFNSMGEKSMIEGAMGMPVKRARIIPPGIDILPKADKRSSRKSLGIPLDRTVVCSVSRLVPVKGLEHLVESMKGLDGHLYIIGKGPEEARLKRLAGNSGNITFTGFVSDEKKRRYISASDIFVVSSFAEGLPLSLLEAMSQGKACVVTDIGLPVEDGKTGIVVPARDSAALSGAIARLGKTPGLRERLGRAAESFVRKTYTKKACADGYLETIRNNLKYTSPRNSI
jgi:glycosyltransferase involved in cell wall biosynthesis